MLANQFMFVARTAQRERTMIMDIVAMVAFFRSFGLLCSKLAISPWKKIKGILHQKIFYRLNLIFWIIMGCGIAHFGRKGLKTTET